MKNWKQLLALLLSLVMIASLCACGGDADGNASPSGANKPTSGGPSDAPAGTAGPNGSADPGIKVDLTQDALSFAAGLPADQTLLTVNGVPLAADLTLYWLALSCNNFMSYYGMFGLQLTDQLEGGGTYADQMRTSAVTIAAYNELLKQKAAELGCLPTDAQVQEARDSMMANGQEDYDMLKEAFGLTDGSMEYLYLSDAYYENVLNALVPTATGEMLNDYAYQAKHILIKTIGDDNQPLPDDEAAERQKQAEDILAQLQAADDLEAKFDELMNEYSEDGRGEDGALSAPDGYTTTRGEMVAEFEEAALALKPGEISGLVKSTYGWHIILRGEVDDLQGYADQCREYNLDEQMGVLLEAAEVVRDPALDGLDVAEFFERYSAYQDAVVEKYQPTDSGPEESGAAG